VQIPRSHSKWTKSRGLDNTYNTSGALTASFVYGAGGNDLLEESTGGSPYYYLHDALGSVTSLTSSSGTAVDTYQYSAFGQVRASGATPNPYTYIGAPTDPSTGLVYLNARYLDPATGRFISEDPVRAPALYPYVRDDPTDLEDPSGLIGDPDEELFAAGEEADLEASGDRSAEGALNAAKRGLINDFTGALQAAKRQSADILEELPDGGGRQPNRLRTTPR
jgi:RHS repeat-associated protein